jgi:hypothetical protein
VLRRLDGEQPVERAVVERDGLGRPLRERQSRIAARLPGARDLLGHQVDAAHPRRIALQQRRCADPAPAADLQDAISGADLQRVGDEIVHRLLARHALLERDRIAEWDVAPVAEVDEPAGEDRQRAEVARAIDASSYVDPILLGCHDASLS